MSGIQKAHMTGACQLPRLVAAWSMLVLLTLTLVPSAHAREANLPIVRDAEIEELLGDYAAPLMGAAGLGRGRTEIVLVNSPKFNAFVSGRRIFVNTGTIVQAETPNEVIGVLAHEMGHLAGGHQQRLRQRLERAKTIAVVSALLGAGTIAAGAASKNRSIIGAGGGLAMGGGEAARRQFLAYQRSEELTADRSAVEYLNKTRQSGKGLLTSFSRMQRNLSLISDRVDPYQVSHPMPRERISSLENLARQSPYFNKSDPASLQARHDMARAKILAYSGGPSAAEEFARKTATPRAALYGRTIAKFLYGSPREALPMIDRLIGQQPSNPYLHEIKGEILLKARDADGAVNAFTRASQLDKTGSGLIQSALGHALVLKGDAQSLQRAVGELEVALSLEPVNPTAYRHLAMAYGRLGDVGNADLATAEENFHAGRYKQAKIFAARAKRRFPRNSPQRLRADDIQRFQEP